jgi:hypothetical protein
VHCGSSKPLASSGVGPSEGSRESLELRGSVRCPKGSLCGQATMETLFVMFMIFLLIAAIYQVFLIHNTLYQMAANAYYDAFKMARDGNKSDQGITKSSKPLTLAKVGGGSTGSQATNIPIIPLYQSSVTVSTQVNRNYYIEYGTEGDPFDIASKDGSGSVAHGNQTGAPTCSASCACPIDPNDPNGHTILDTQLSILMTTVTEPTFPHVACNPSHPELNPPGSVCLPGKLWGTTPNCH